MFQVYRELASAENPNPASSSDRGAISHLSSQQKCRLCDKLRGLGAFPRASGECIACAVAGIRSAFRALWSGHQRQFAAVLQVLRRLRLDANAKRLYYRMCQASSGCRSCSLLDASRLRPAADHDIFIKTFTP
ncbi:MULTISPECIES: hypothetical protein [Thiorhodovibrio]|uniref:hypothetical protein n=1 Tax=Thiorhodovibrio TaxID=61593 RepID=UPI001911748B|nr:MULTISPECIES: hypothetical protein [Thiorhodovibrio]